MSLLILSALAAASSDFEPKGWWAKPTPELAAELLPPDMAKDAISHAFSWPTFQNGVPSSVRFEGKPRKTGDGFCERKTYYVSIYAFGGGAEGDPQQAVMGDKVRLGGCEGIFAHLNPGTSLESGKKALLWLQWARDIARSEAPLPFGLNCRDEVRNDKCANARQALANLPVEKTFIVSKWSRTAHQWQFAVTETEPGQLLWDMKIDATPGRGSVDMVWKIPAPF